MSDTTTILQRLEKKIDRLEDFIKQTTKANSKWITQAQAMEEIGCRATKIKELRMSGKLEWRYAGDERGVMILRKSVDEYNKLK